MRPFQRLLAKTHAPSTGAARLFSQARQNSSASWNCADCRCGTWKDFSSHFRCGFFTTDSPQMEFAALFGCLASSHGIESACFRSCIGRRIALERGTANMPRFFPGQLSNYPSRPLAGLLRLRQQVETLLAWSVLQQSKRIGFRLSPNRSRQPIRAAGR